MLLNALIKRFLLKPFHHCFDTHFFKIQEIKISTKACLLPKTYIKINQKPVFLIEFLGTSNSILLLKSKPSRNYFDNTICHHYLFFLGKTSSFPHFEGLGEDHMDNDLLQSCIEHHKLSTLHVHC